jgi:hypothetical protein
MRSITVGLAAFLAPTAALAQPSAAPASQREPAPERVAAVAAMSVAPPGAVPLEDREAAAAAAPAEPIGIAGRVAEDAAAGRAYFTDTALTSPRGKIGLALRMPTGPAANAEVRYSLTDRLELGVSVLMIDGEDQSVVGLQAKGQIWHNDRAAVAVGLQRYQSTDEYDDEVVTIPTFVASTCLDGKDCLAMFSMSINGVVIGGESNVPVFAGASWALGRRIQFVGEVHVSNDDSNSLTFGYMGVRGASGGIAIDAGIGFGSEGNNDCFDCSSDSAAFPFVGVATRM